MVGVEEEQVVERRVGAMLDERVAEDEELHAPGGAEVGQEFLRPSPAPHHLPCVAGAQGVVGIHERPVQDAGGEPGALERRGQRVAEHQAVLAADGKRHGADEAPQRLLHQRGVVAEGPVEAGIEELEVVARALGHGMAEDLRKLVVGKHHVHLPGLCQEELRHAAEHAVAQVNAVHQAVAVDEFVQHHVVVRRAVQARQLLHQPEVDGVVVEVAREQDAAARGEEDGRAAAKRFGEHAFRGGVKKRGDAGSILHGDRLRIEGHGVTVTAT